jgi:hypothetical protein
MGIHDYHYIITNTSRISDLDLCLAHYKLLLTLKQRICPQSRPQRDRGGGGSFFGRLARPLLPRNRLLRHCRGGSAIDGRTTRYPGYTVSQRKRKRIEECFGWLKTIALMRKVRHRGVCRVDWIFTFVCAAYNLVRMRNLTAVPAVRLVPGGGVEPPRYQVPADFEADGSTPEDELND